MEKPTIYYVYDALCGWCYSFGPVIQKFEDNYRDRVQTEVLSGGMVVGGRVGPVSNMADYIRQAVPRLTEITGVKFGEAYFTQVLDKGTYISNSEPPSVALSILKEQAPEKPIALAHNLQKLQFVEGRDFNEVETYLPLAATYGISEEVFRHKFTSDDYRLKAHQDFELVQSWGITGFPAVVCQFRDKLYLAARGFTPYEQLTATVEQILAGEITG